MENYAQYGLEAEKVVLDYIQEYSGIENDHHKPSKGREDYFKLSAQRGSYGDIAMDINDTKLYINVVRGTWVSHSSLSRYKGHFYCMFPNGDISDPSKGRVVLNSTIKGFNSTCKKNNKQDTYVADKPGFRYGGMKAYVTLDDFLVHVTKSIIMNISPKDKDFWSFMRKPFIDNLKLRGYNG